MLADVPVPGTRRRVCRLEADTGALALSAERNLLWSGRVSENMLSVVPTPIGEDVLEVRGGR